jgi:hypothetical protein
LHLTSRPLSFYLLVILRPTPALTISRRIHLVFLAGQTHPRLSSLPTAGNHSKFSRRLVALRGVASGTGLSRCSLLSCRQANHLTRCANLIYHYACSSATVLPFAALPFPSFSSVYPSLLTTPAPLLPLTWDAYINTLAWVTNTPQQSFNPDYYYYSI